MNNFQLPKHDVIKFFETEELNGNIARAQHRMRPRPFTDRFKKLKIIAMVGTFFFPAISVLTAISFLFGYIYEATNYFFLSVLIAFIILALIELTKNHLINNGLTTYFSNSGKVALIFLFASLFSIASFMMSYNGAELLVKNMDKSKETIALNTTDNINKIEKKYEGLISMEKQKIAVLHKKAKKQWNGLLTPGQSERVLRYENNITYYQQLKEKEKDQILNTEKIELNKAKSQMGYNAYVFKIIAAINELLTILSIAFVVFYDFKTVQQNNYLLKYKEEKPEELQPKTQHNSIPTPQTAIIEPKTAEALQQTPINLNKHKRNIIMGFAPSNLNVSNAPVNNEPVNTGIKKCEHCGQDYKPYRTDQRFCKTECRMKWHKEHKGFDIKLYRKRKVKV